MTSKTFLSALASIAFTGCASAPAPAPASAPVQPAPTVLQGEHSGKYVVRVSRREGKNVIEVISGNPSKMSLAVAQAFIDDTVELEEGAVRVITLDEFRPI
jgi:hypothetical protein